MRIKWLVLLGLVIGLTGCKGAEPSQTLLVFGASSLTDAFEELAAAFEGQNEGVEVLLNYAGSSQLAAQLLEGAAADVFAPANEAQMAKVVEDGRIEASTVSLFVSNRLTIIVPADNPAGIEGLEGLARPGVQLVLAVEGVPVRQYTDEIVGAMTAEFQAGFYDNLVSEEDNVRQVAAKVALGEADAGIVYISDVTPDLADQVLQIMIPAGQNVVAAYPIAPLADGQNGELAGRFIDFVLSDGGQMILAKWGFGPPPVG